MKNGVIGVRGKFRVLCCAQKQGGDQLCLGMGEGSHAQRKVWSLAHVKVIREESGLCYICHRSVASHLFGRGNLGSINVV